jgi:hypothetical protein
MTSTLLLLIGSALAAGGAPSFEAQTIDQVSVVGSLTELTPERAVLQTADGKVELELNRLLSLTSKDTKPSGPAASSAVLSVELVDGSILAASQYVAGAEQATITLANGKKVVAPVKAVRSVRLAAETAKTAGEWTRILGLKADGDVLVVRNGESVDYHQGVLREVGEDAVKFELDGDTLPIKRAKVFGFTYHHIADGGQSAPACFLLDRDGSRWSVASFSLGNKLAWTTPGGVKVERPLEEIKSLDFSLGKVRFVSDLKPDSVAWTPFFAQAAVSPTLERFYAPRMDRNFDNNPLQIKKTAYPKGLALHSRTELVYRLPEGFGHFAAVAGIDDAVAPKGNVRLVIRGDDRVLFDSAIRGADPPQNIELDIAGVRRLAILADYGDAFGPGDHLILGNARILK